MDERCKEGEKTHEGIRGSASGTSKYSEIPGGSDTLSKKADAEIAK